MQEIVAIFEYTFFQKALFAIFAASVACGLIGTYIVAKRIVFLAGAVSHISFGGVGAAFYFGHDPFAGALIFSLISAAGLAPLGGRLRLREDSLIGILWSMGMAVGLIFVSLSPGYVPNLMSYLFGSILTVSAFEIIYMAAVSLFTAAFFVLFYHKILASAFQEDFAQTQNIRPKLFRTVMLILAALTIVSFIRIVGIVLLIAMLSIPQSAASLVFKRFSSIAILSSIITFISGFSGLLVSYVLDIPSGAAIIFSAVIIFLIIYATVNVLHRVRKSVL